MASSTYDGDSRSISPLATDDLSFASAEIMHSTEMLANSMEMLASSTEILATSMDFETTSTEDCPPVEIHSSSTAFPPKSQEVDSTPAETAPAPVEESRPPDVERSTPIEIPPKMDSSAEERPPALVPPPVPERKDLKALAEAARRAEGRASPTSSEASTARSEAVASPPEGSELYYSASSEVSLCSEAEGAMAGHVAAMRERYESMSRAHTPAPPSLHPSP